MSKPNSSIKVPVDLTNPGQFFACCGLLELADRLVQEPVGWFDDDQFHVSSNGTLCLDQLILALSRLTITNTMSPDQVERLSELTGLAKKNLTPEFEAEKKALESQRREDPIILSGPIDFRIDWFRDGLAGGSRFKTWAGQQSVIEIAKSMHQGCCLARTGEEAKLFESTRGIGLPFNFDSDLGAQGSALDIGFSFDPLAGSEATRIAGSCKPSLEFLCFLGLQRFRPRELHGENRFIYSAWTQPLPITVACAAVSQSIPSLRNRNFAFRLLYRTKYLKSFLPAIPFQGDTNGFD